MKLYAVAFLYNGFNHLQIVGAQTEKDAKSIALANFLNDNAYISMIVCTEVPKDYIITELCNNLKEIIRSDRSIEAIEQYIEQLIHLPK